jgi:hypothetical protein
MIFARIILALALFMGAAQAQMNSFFPGPGTPAATAVTFAITFGSSQEDATGQSTYTIPSVGVGAADTNRYAVVAVCIRAAAPITTPTVTIGGAATTKVIDSPNSGTYSGLFQTNATFTSGTTATVVVSSFGTTGARAAVQGYSVVTSTGTVPSGGAISTLAMVTTTASGAVTVPANGGSIAAACSSANLVPITVTAPAADVTEDKDAVIGASLTTTYAAHDAITRTGSTTYTLSSSSSFAAATSAGVVAAWAP